MSFPSRVSDVQAEILIKAALSAEGRLSGLRWTVNQAVMAAQTGRNSASVQVPFYQRCGRALKVFLGFTLL